jgi:hypothetical protein
MDALADLGERPRCQGGLITSKLISHGMASCKLTVGEGILEVRRSSAPPLSSSN